MPPIRSSRHTKKIMIDWQRLLDAHRVEYKPTRHNLYVSCPWCGTGDQGQHLGISIRKPWHGYGCWRNREHRGRSAVTLLAAVLRISHARAIAILGDQNTGTPISDDALLTSFAALLGAKPAQKPVGPLKFPPDIYPLEPGAAHCRPFTAYLRDRGYTSGEVFDLVDEFNVHCAMHGRFFYRVIIPVYDRHGKLITWTGRGIGRQPIPYMTLTADPETAEADGTPLAHRPSSDCLLQEQRLFRPPYNLLVAGEGPFDAIRMQMALLDYDGYRATCIFGKALSDKQIDMLAELGSLYRHKFLLLDPDARFNVLALMERLRPFGFRPLYLPEPWEDPGDRKLPLNVLRDIMLNATRTKERV